MNSMEVLKNNQPEAYNPAEGLIAPDRKIPIGIACAAAAAVIAAGCGSANHDPASAGSVKTVAETTSLVPETIPATSPKPQEVDPKFPKPLSFDNGEFVGSMTIKYKTPLKGYEPIAEYWTRKGINPPKPEKEITHRLVASMVIDGRDTVTNENLAEGGVLRQASSSRAAVIGAHNVTPVVAPVREVINGKSEIHNETAMSINAVPQIGDEMIIRIAGDPSDKDLDQFTYKAVKTEIIDPNNSAKWNGLLKSIPGKQIIRTYTCWEPGSSRQRFVVTWQQVESESVPGKVMPVGEAQGAKTGIR